MSFGFTAIKVLAEIIRTSAENQDEIAGECLLNLIPRVGATQLDLFGRRRNHRVACQRQGPLGG